MCIILDIAALSNVGVLQRLHDAICLLLERFPPPCCNICSSERSGHPRREACARAGHCFPVTGFYLVLTSINVHHSWYIRSIKCRCVAKTARRYTFAAWKVPTPFSLSMVLHHKALPTCIWGRCLCQSIWYSRSIKCSCVAKTARRYTFAAWKVPPLN